MPLPGDQHRDTPATTNPFVEHKPHITEFTAQEIATLQSRLDKQLGPEYISTRPGAGGGKVHYLAAEKVINLANEVFGFNGWSSAIQNVQIDFVDEHPQSGKITLGLSTIVRVTLRDGSFHEDIGYGHIENCKGKAAAFEKAKKEAATDAMKRALRNFGNVLGNCLYDKEYLQRVTKVKIAPAKWDAENLHRHPDYAPIKREAIADAAQTPRRDIEKGSAAQRQTSVQSGVSFGSTEFEDEFGNPFDEADLAHPDEVRIEDTHGAADVEMRTPGPATTVQQQKQGVQRMHSMPQIRPPNLQQPTSVQNPQPPQRPPGPPRPSSNLANVQASRGPQQQTNNQKQAGAGAQPGVGAAQSGSATSNLSLDGSVTTTDFTYNNTQQQQQRQPNLTTNSLSHNSSNQEHHEDQQAFPAPRALPPGNPEGFITGRSAELLNQAPGARPPNSALAAFNPHADSPSIRRTHGINPGKSAPVMRQAITGTAAPASMAAPQQPQQQPQTNVSNAAAAAAAAPTRQSYNYVNPSADPTRRIGMPPSAVSNTVQHNRNAYKPPTTTTTATTTPAKRPPLTDVSNIQQMDGAGEAKKVKLDGSAVASADAATDDGAVASEAVS